MFGVPAEHFRGSGRSGRRDANPPATESFRARLSDGKTFPAMKTPPLIFLLTLLCVLSSAPAETLVRFEKQVLETKFYAEGAAFGELKIDGVRAELSLRRFFERV